MEFRPEVSARSMLARHPRVRPVALCALAATLLIASAGCGTKEAERSESAATPAGDSSSVPSAAAVHKSAQASSPRSETRSAGVTNRVVLTSKGCVEFEPQWATVRVGQSLTWHSELKSPVTIHVSPGGFGKSAFVVRAGATVSSGPATTAGTYSVWTEPAACQGSPRGVQGSGPGVKVEGGGSGR